MVPTVRLRRLAAEMRRLREQAALSREAVADRTGVNAATLYRLETARVQRPQPRTLRALLDLYDVADPHRASLLALAREGAHRKWPWADEGQLADEYSTYINFEAEARSLSDAQVLFVPGLLQTEPYARALFDAGLLHSTEADVENRVRARMQRQALLHKPEPLRLHAIVDESALRRVVGGAVTMRNQLRHLVVESREPNIQLQVIPFSAGAHAGMSGSFAILDFPEPDPGVVYLESVGGQLLLEGATVLCQYRERFEWLSQLALSPERSVRLVTALGESLEGHGDE